MGAAALETLQKVKIDLSKLLRFLFHLNISFFL